METNFAKPTAVSAELPEAIYCIHCEGMVKAEQGANGMKHAVGAWKEEVEFCFFPDGYAFVASPETPPHPVDEMRDTGDWAAQDAQEEPDDGDMCADEVGAWED